MRITLGLLLVLTLAIGSPVTRTRQIRRLDNCVLVPIPASAVHHAWEGKPRVRNKNGTSSNWGGYALETSLSAPQNNAVSDVKGQWTVPSVTASTSPNTYSSIWVGIDGYSDGSVEQTGTEQDWSNGHPVYYAWFEMYPKSAYQILNFPVNPGDTIATEVQYNGNGSFKLTIVNASKNVSFSTTQRLKNARRQSAEWIVEAPYSGGTLPLADFGTVSLLNCSATLNGATGPINNSAWQHDSITMATSGGTIKAQPSALASSGTGFSVTWHHE